jgi:hypothetical protein
VALKHGQRIGATNASYSTGVAGIYACVVSNACGSATSSAATLTVFQCLTVSQAKQKADNQAVYPESESVGLTRFISRLIGRKAGSRLTVIGPANQLKMIKKLFHTEIIRDTDNRDFAPSQRFVHSSKLIEKSITL